MPENVQEVVKNGDVWLEQTISRTASGLLVWIKTTPEVEAFMKAQSDGNLDELSAHTKNWKPVGENPMQLYRLKTDLGSDEYRLSQVGGHLNATIPANLSFLRFVGISSPDGVKFLINGLYDRNTTKLAAKIILASSKLLFQEYIADVNISLRISSQEV